MILMDFSYFFLLFFGFLAGVWDAVWGISAVSATFSCSFKLFGWVWGAVLEILGITAPQDPLTMLPTYGYCTL